MSSRLLAIASRFLPVLVCTALIGCQGLGPAPVAPSSGAPTSAAAPGTPTVRIDSPANGSTFLSGQSVQVQATGADSFGVARIDLLVGSVVVASVTPPGGTPAVSFTGTLVWTPSVAGAAALAVVARRTDGTSSDPATIAVTVQELGTSNPDPTSPATTSPTATLATAPPTPPATTGPTATPLVTLAPTSRPTPTPRPTARPTPRPTRRPTPSPTATPLPADMVAVRIDAPAALVKGVEAKFHWYARNDGPGGAINYRIEVLVGNAFSDIQFLSTLPPGVAIDDNATITPQDCGEQTLLFRVTPENSDPNPGNNRLVSSVTIACP